MGKQRKQQKQKNQAMKMFGSAKSYCAVKNQADEAIIYIYDEIGGWGVWADDVIYALQRITADTIIVRVNSPGGFVGEAIAIHNALRKHPAKIITEIDNQAASAATFMVQAGDIRRIAENAHMMFHDLAGAVKGSEADIRAYADHMPVMRDAIIATYAYRTNISEDEVRQMITSGQDVYLTPQEALDMGFVDEIQSLKDMGEAPNITPPEEDTQARGANNSMNSKQWMQSLNELSAFLPASNTSDDTRRDHGKGELMKKEELIAKLNDVGIDVSALQQTCEEQATALANNQEKLDTFNTLLGERSHDEVKAALAVADAHREALVESIVSSKRALKQVGDAEVEVEAAIATYSVFNTAELEALAEPLKEAASGRADFTPAGQAPGQTSNRRTARTKK